VIGIAANTSMFSEEEAKNYIQQLEEKTNIPVTDPIRYGMQEIGDIISSN
jgi:uncharacterized NAD-dependent epimerase/dehydratase family protein